MKKWKEKFLRWCKILFLCISCFLIFCVLFAFTTGPYWIYHWLGTSKSEFHFQPECIIIMGGAGYPGESSLIRSYYAAETWKRNPSAKIIITQPAAACVRPELSDAWGIRKDLIIRGVDSTKVLLEIKGKNTREEGMEVMKIFPGAESKHCVIVTSPEHMRRSILTFKKLGFKQLGGVPTWNASGPVDLDYKDSNLGGNKVPLPNVGGSLQLRYQFWNHLRYQVICYRELMGLAWYQLRGWI
ncbi:MAG: YdcF family protein [Bacteroidetes bacterium]|nr:YdcF family protein [Bacteroidota bacterium]